MSIICEDCIPLTFSDCKLQQRCDLWSSNSSNYLSDCDGRRRSNVNAKSRAPRCREVTNQVIIWFNYRQAQVWSQGSLFYATAKVVCSGHWARRKSGASLIWVLRMAVLVMGLRT